MIRYIFCGGSSLDPMTAVCSHREGGQRGIASGHGDPEHYWSHLGMAYTMDGFRAEVRAEMQAAGTPLPFEDVREGAWYYDDVVWGFRNGLVRGMDETHFSPDRPCTRAETVALLRRFSGFAVNGEA